MYSFRIKNKKGLLKIDDFKKISKKCLGHFKSTDKSEKNLVRSIGTMINHELDPIRLRSGTIDKTSFFTIVDYCFDYYLRFKEHPGVTEEKINHMKVSFCKDAEKEIKGVLAKEI